STRIAVEPARGAASALVPGAGREVPGVAPLQEGVDDEKKNERKVGKANQGCKESADRAFLIEASRRHPSLRRRRMTAQKLPACSSPN
ncbi:hypothetical protein, partial [Methylobacterium oxalidis]|uniref:hypothetical protein n=1 Tax=Methylobacterium oxalidis TaxID=944322 RepID=UPI003314EED8